MGGIVIVPFISVILLLPVGDSYNVCTSNSENACTKLEGNSHDFRCLHNYHDIDCILHINSTKSQLGRISNEVAMIAANFTTDNIVVIAEINKTHPPLSSVIVVKSNISDDFANLKGKKLCHPGFKHDYIISYLILNELMNKLIDLDQTKFCSPNNETLIEKQINYLSNILGDTCMPGPWTQNTNLDIKLKKKYLSLCKLCASESCDVDYKNPFNDSMKCLINNNADIAVTTLREAQIFFNTSNSYSNQYKYLCKNGSTQLSSTPCTWTNQFNDLIIAEITVVNDLVPLLKNKLQLENDIAGETLKTILLKDEETIAFINQSNYPSLSDYVKARRNIPTIKNSTRCDLSLKFCTLSNLEQEKCKWFSQAAMNQGIQPVVECIQNEANDCLNDIRKKRADFAVLSTDYGYLSYKKDLIPIAYLNQKNFSTILIVINEGSNITSFDDLKGKKACIPYYGGKEWLVFIDTIRMIKHISTDGTYEKIISEYLGDSCIPGAIANDYESYNNEGLCNLCIAVKQPASARYCRTDETNKYYGSNGALMCLNDSIADFAVITKEDIKMNLTKGKVLCKNGTLSSVTGLDVDDNCSLNKVASSIVVARIDNIKNPDISVFISESDRWFGEDSSKVFSLYGFFNDTPNLLYKNSTTGQNLARKTVYDDNFVRLLENVHFNFSVSEPSYSSTMKPFIVLQFIPLIYYLFFL